LNDPAKNPIAVVTGASRGAGRGIAIALGARGATVYVTGRTARTGDSALEGSIAETAEEVTAAGGKGIAVQVDHADDAQVRELFAQIGAAHGRLDILVNNVALVHEQLTHPGPFWEKSIELAGILDVGLRSQYIASYYAAPLLIASGRGLIAFTSSFGSVCYMHGAAYGAQKAGVDKFAADMAVDFREHNVAALAIWMGPLLTFRMREQARLNPEQYAGFAAVAETPEYTGRLIAGLYDDPKLMERSGQTVIGAELGQEYGLRDEGDKQPPSYREMLGAPRIPHPAIVR